MGNSLHDAMTVLYANDVDIDQAVTRTKRDHIAALAPLLHSHCDMSPEEFWMFADLAIHRPRQLSRVITESAHPDHYGDVMTLIRAIVI